MGEKGFKNRKWNTSVKGNPKEGGGPLLTCTQTNPAEVVLLPVCTCTAEMQCVARDTSRQISFLFFRGSSSFDAHNDSADAPVEITATGIKFRGLQNRQDTI